MHMQYSYLLGKPRKCCGSGRGSNLFRQWQLYTHLDQCVVFWKASVFPKEFSEMKEETEKN